MVGCASNPQSAMAPKIDRISAEDLEKLMPKPTPKLALNELVVMAKSGVTSESLIAKIKETGSTYDLTPAQMIDLKAQGVPEAVIDYMYKARQQMLRDEMADQINKKAMDHAKEMARKNEELRRQQMQMNSMPYYDPFWYPRFGFGYRRYPFGFYNHW